MSFLHLSLIAGLAATLVPVALHLFGQREPQLIDFPALRFVRETRRDKNASWQLRHILLLLLRVLLLAAIVFALAKPRVHSAALDGVVGATVLATLALLATLITAAAFAGKRGITIWSTSLVVALALWGAAGLWGYRSLTAAPPLPSADSSAPVAAVIIVDNGPTMGYRIENASRLEAAQDQALWLLEKLPKESQVAILGGAPVGSLSLDPSSAKSQVELLESKGARVDLFSRLRTAIDLVLANELERKEVYVLTDLMESSWATVQPGLSELIAQHDEEILLQIIDVGNTTGANWALGDLTVSQHTVGSGAEVEFEITIERANISEEPGAKPGQPENVTVDLIHERPGIPSIREGELMTPEARAVSRKILDFSETSSHKVQFTASVQELGTHHFTVQLDSSDALPLDNQRYASIVVRPAQPTLIFADDLDLANETLQFIVDPFQGASQGDVEALRYTQLAQAQLDRFSLVWLHDPPPLSATSVQRLIQFVENGAAVIVTLGPNLGTAEGAAGNAIEQLLPGGLAGVRDRAGQSPPAFLNPVVVSSPIFQDVAEQIDNNPWNRFPVYRNWTFDALSDNAQVVMQYSDDLSPALLVESVGQGQVITLSTPIPQKELLDQPTWNDLWIADDPVWAFILMRGMLETGFNAAYQSMNFQVGAPISLPNQSTLWPSSYELFYPDGHHEQIQAADGYLGLVGFDQPGILRLRSRRGEPMARGFSLNTPAKDTSLQRVDAGFLEEQLGADKFHIASNRDEIESSVGRARFGRELYPMLMLLVAGLFLAEQAMSNRFYKIKFR